MEAAAPHPDTLGPGQKTQSARGHMTTTKSNNINKKSLRYQVHLLVCKLL